MNPYPPEHYYARCTDASARLWKEEYMAEFTVVNSDPVSREVAEIERLHAEIAKTHPHINEVRFVDQVDYQNPQPNFVRFNPFAAIGGSPKNRMVAFKLDKRLAFYWREEVQDKNGSPVAGLTTTGVAILSLDRERVFINTIRGGKNLQLRALFQKFSKDVAVDLVFNTGSLESEWCVYDPVRLDTATVRGVDTQSIRNTIGPCPLCRSSTLAGLDAYCTNCTASCGYALVALVSLGCDSACRIAQLIRNAKCNVCNQPYSHRRASLVCPTCCVNVADQTDLDAADLLMPLGDTPFEDLSKADVQPGDYIRVFTADGSIELGVGRVLVVEDNLAAPSMVHDTRSMSTRLNPNLSAINVIANRRRGETGSPVSVLMESLTEEGNRRRTPKVLHVIPVVPPSQDQPLASGNLFSTALPRRTVQVPVDKKTDPRVTAFNNRFTLNEVFVDDPVVPRQLMHKFLADCSLHRKEITARFEVALPALLRIERAVTNPAKPPEKRHGSPATDRIDAAEALVVIKRAFYKMISDPANRNIPRLYPGLAIPDSYSPSPSPG